MPRDRTARARIRSHLVSMGPVADRSGYATSTLKDAIHYEGSSVAFIQLIAAMERDGEIVRDIRGKRTYGISATPETLEARDNESVSTKPATGSSDIVIDYDALAKAIVREFWKSSTRANADSADDARVERELYARRIEEARAQLSELLATAERVSVDGGG